MISIGISKSLAVFMVEYVGLDKAKPAEAAVKWTEIHPFFFDLPEKEDFKNSRNDILRDPVLPD